MDDIRCPMCGKANPAGAETCAYCGARIKPPIPPPGAPSDAAEPEWLAGLRGGNFGQMDASAPAAQDEPTEPDDWLTQIRRRQNEENASGANDWLSQLSGQADSPSVPGLPDWLNPVPPSEDDPSAPSTPGQPPAQEPGALDWAAFRADVHPTESAATPGEEVPDWLSQLSTLSLDSDQPATSPAQPIDFSGPAAEPAQPAEGDVPDWLSALQSVSGGPETPATEPQPGVADDQPDWLSMFQASPSASLPETQSAPDEPAASEPGEPSTTDLPDWLSTLEPAAQEPQFPFAPSTAEPANDRPDWLSALQPPANPAGPVAAEPAPAPSGDLPDWMSMLEPPAGQAEPLAAEPAPAPAGDLPDWLSAFKPVVDEPESTPAAPASDHTDWLAALQSSVRDIPPTTEPTPAVANEGSAQLLPDWLASDSPAAADQPAPAVSEPLAADQIPAPDLLSALPAADSPLAFGKEDLPDWLGDEQEPSAVENVAAGGDLEKAQLPGWLQAMRPVEDIVPDAAPRPSEGQTIETSGPLRGLVDALPGEDLVLRYRKPPVYSARLQVSDRQRQNAALLEDLLPAESQPQTVRPVRRRLPQQVVRALVALALVLAVLSPLLTGSRLMPTPRLYPPELVAMNSGLAALPAGSPVLLAVDYEPALSGEMRLAALPVVNHLLARQARLTLVSSVPTGPVLAEALLAQAGQAYPDYSLTENVVNLGFLAGGTTGLQEFARRPQFARPFTLDGFAAWTHPALAGVNSLQNFSAVVVLTESTETARAWIEQVQPALGAAPMYIVASAQSAPMVQPYVESGQVQGLLSGYAGGIMYGQILQQPDSGLAYWDAYQMGLFLAVVLILIGAVAQLFSWLASRPTRARKG